MSRPSVRRLQSRARSRPRSVGRGRTARTTRASPPATRRRSAVHTRLASRNLRSIDMPAGARRTLDVGLYALTIGTSWSRIEAGWHFPADTLFSMALGNFMASFVNDAFLGLDSGSASLTVSRDAGWSNRAVAHALAMSAECARGSGFSLTSLFRGQSYENSRRHRLCRRQTARSRHRRPGRTARRRSAGRDQGERRVPHRRVHALRRGSRRPVPGDLRSRRRRRRGGRRSRRDFAEGRRSRHSAVYARVPPVQGVPVAQDQSVHGDPRDAGQGRDAGRHQPLLDRQGQDPSLHGLLDVLQSHGAAGDRAGEDPRGRAVRQGLLHRLRRDDRHRRGHEHREGRAGRERRRVRPRRHRPERRAGREAGRRESHHRRRPQSAAPRARREVRHDRLRESRRKSAAIWCST